MKLVFILFLCTLACSVASDGDQLEGSLSGLEAEYNLETSLRLKRRTPLYKGTPKTYSAIPYTATTYDKKTQYTPTPTYPATPVYPSTPDIYPSTPDIYPATPNVYPATYTPHVPAYGAHPGYEASTYPTTTYGPTIPFAPYGASTYLSGGYSHTLLTGDEVHDVLTVIVSLWNILLPGPPGEIPQSCLDYVEGLLKHLPKQDVTTILTVIKNILFNIGSYNSRQSATLVGIEIQSLSSSGIYGKSGLYPPSEGYSNLADAIVEIVKSVITPNADGLTCVDPIEDVLENLNDEGLQRVASLLIYLWEKNYSNPTLKDAAHKLREILAKHYLPVLTLKQLLADPEYEYKGYLLGSETLEEVMRTQCAPYTIEKYKTKDGYNEKLAALLKKAILKQLGADSSYNKQGYTPPTYEHPAPAPHGKPYAGPAYHPTTYEHKTYSKPPAKYNPAPYADKPVYKEAPAVYDEPPTYYEEPAAYNPPADYTPTYDAPIYDMPTTYPEPSYEPSNYGPPAPAYDDKPKPYKAAYKAPKKEVPKKAAYKGKPPMAYKGKYRARRDVEGSAEAQNLSE